MKKRNPEANCGNCPYCFKLSKDERNGLCQRFPPMPVVVIERANLKYEYERVGVQPDTEALGICGEHPAYFLPEPKEPVKIPEPLPVREPPVETSSGRLTGLLNVKQIAEVLGWSQRSVWRGRDSGLLPQPINLGRNLRVNSEVLYAWIEDGCPNCRRTGWTPGTRAQKKVRVR